MAYSMDERRSIVKTRQRERKNESESNFWQQVFFQSFDDTCSVSRASEHADSAIESYRERFPLMELDDVDIDNIYKLEIGPIDEPKSEEVNGGSSGSDSSSSTGTTQD